MALAWRGVSLLPLLVLFLASCCSARIAFEKLTEYDFRGTTYYTIQNLSLWECQGWCKEEPECAAASFSFVINPLAPVQETLCLLQNETLAANPSATPQRAVSLYYMIKLTVRSDNVCNRPWQFERVPSKRLRGLDNAHIHANSKEDCVAACLNEKRFPCRSAEYNYVTLQCHLSEYDRRTVDAGVTLEDAVGVDYFENLCLEASDSCRFERAFEQPALSVPATQVSQYVDIHYYVDKELMANSVAACQRACEIEYEFLCRSYLYKGPPAANSYNCQLFHLDHFTLPDGEQTYQSTDRPLLDDGTRTGTYYENTCKRSLDGTSGSDLTTEQQTGSGTDAGSGLSGSTGSGSNSGSIDGSGASYGQSGVGGGDQTQIGSDGNAIVFPGGQPQPVSSGLTQQGGEGQGQYGNTSQSVGGNVQTLPGVISQSGSSTQTSGSSSGTSSGSSSSTGSGSSSGSSSGSVSGSTSGSSTGTVSGSTSGSSGLVSGSTSGSSTGTVSGSTSSSSGSVSGSTSGSSSGTVSGSTSGSSGSVSGSTSGSSTGTESGATSGSSTGSVSGSSSGSVSGATSASSSSSVSGSSSSSSTGTVSGSTSDSSSGMLSGSTSGSSTSTVSGSTTGTSTGSVSGSSGDSSSGTASGLIYGTTSGSSSGTVSGSSSGAASGSSSGSESSSQTGSASSSAVDSTSGSQSSSSSGSSSSTSSSSQTASGSTSGTQTVGSSQGGSSSSSISSEGSQTSSGSLSGSGSQTISGSTSTSESGYQTGSSSSSSTGSSSSSSSSSASSSSSSSSSNSQSASGSSSSSQTSGSSGSQSSTLEGSLNVQGSTSGSQTGGGVSGILGSGGSGLTGGQSSGQTGTDNSGLIVFPDTLPGGGTPIGASITGEPGSDLSGGDAAFSTYSPDTDSGTAGGDSGDVNCDPTGVCYDVSVHCKDTRIAVEVATNRPFNGRIYALGRSETCNIAVINSDKFRLDLTMAGQDCNTQSVSGVYTNTVVIQHHSVVMTKTDKIYKIRCTYDMSPKNITFGMMPIRDPDMIPITSAPEAPPPRIRILDSALREVETVRIGDSLTFRIEIPEKTPYGIFARSCVAMAKDSRSTFQIIDDDGCPVEPSIFPRFYREGSALQSVYEAFRFTESYGVIFQCNVKYCLGPCEPAKCTNGRNTVDSWGRRKRRGVRSVSRDGRGHVQQTTKEAALAAAAEAPPVVESASSSGDEMSISQEILVLDLGDEVAAYHRSDPTPQVAETDPYYTDSKVSLFETCPTRSSVLALAVTCAILLLIYVLTVFYFVMRKWIRPTKNIR